jgi:hypothetical protein
LDSIYGEKHWLYVATMHNLALMYEAVGKVKEAHDTMEKVLALRLQVGAPAPLSLFFGQIAVMKC